jgi:hypothetical protein
MYLWLNVLSRAAFSGLLQILALRLDQSFWLVVSVCGNWKSGEHKFWRLSCQMADSSPQKVYRLQPTARSQALDSEKMFDLSPLISKTLDFYLTATTS